MDFTRLTQGEKIAGASGLALILIMFIFNWYGVEVGGESVPDSGANAWEAFGFIDIVLFVTVAAAIGLALISASQTEVGLPVAASAVVAGLGILSVILVLYRIVDTPGDLGAAGELLDVNVTREIGVWLGPDRRHRRRLRRLAGDAGGGNLLRRAGRPPPRAGRGPRRAPPPRLPPLRHHPRLLRPLLLAELRSTRFRDAPPGEQGLNRDGRLRAAVASSDGPRAGG